MKVVFTIITGNYDNPQPIAVKNPEWRYICITDDMTIDGGDWELIPIETLNPPKGLNPIRLQRWAKIIGAVEYFQCDTIYLDGSYEIRNDISQILLSMDRSYSDGNVMTLQNMILKIHPKRNSYIDEGIACIKLNKAHPDSIRRQIKEYEAEGLEYGGGMYETGVLIRKYTPKVIEFCQLWWAEIEKHTHRDQLSIMKALKDCGIIFSTMTPGFFNEFVTLHKHKK